MSLIGAVVIGRNEGARLVACLASLADQQIRVVYVDSGSTDGSVKAAEEAGAEVVILDTDTPFTAARARNAGYRALASTGTRPDYVQFVDGDCRIVPGWMAKARAALDAQPDLGIVTGWRAEIHPEASVYNRLCDFEWHRPAGDIEGCGGDMMVRAEAFEAAGGFNPRIIAAEDEEFCTRMRKAGWRVHRLPEDMTLHDANMLRFGQWWQRAVRTGHGFSQVGALHPEYFTKERRRVWIYAALLPVLAVGALFTEPLLLLAVLAVYLLSYLRTVQGLRRAGLDLRDAAEQAVLLTLSKFPNLLGMLTYIWRMATRKDMRIIEYK
ncbi:glycosyltransferase family 2 protein [Thalassococcus sp. S3]|uniref:glycosyltransferase n=1 Tax=Thalassococcus sp. S3 TaxID=2017482 RepID=UPI0010241C4E|nr:glycosyltransferase [Thalassococcus sp. S3]QBF31973.1 glycosyl transferase [Thalassococcus sp. S3]